MAEGGVGVSDVTRGPNPEYKTLLKSYPRLVECIAKSPGYITDQLYSNTVLTQEERSDVESDKFSDKEKARKILDMVMSKIKFQSPLFFYVFIGIMEKEEWMRDYTDRLREDLEAEKRSNSITANNPTTVETIGPNPARTAPALDIFTSLSSQSKIESRFKPFDESDLENKTEKMKHKFAVLVTSVSMALKREGVTTNDLTFHLRELRSVRSDHIEANQVCYFGNAFMQQIEEECENDVGKVLPAIQKCYSWINVALIESIIDAFLNNDEGIQALWASYQSHYKEYCTERVCKIPMPLNGSRFLPRLLQKSTTIAFKIDCEWDNIRLDRLNSIRASIQRLLDLQPYTLYLRSVKQGCVELVFEVPQHVADVIFPPTEEQLLALEEHHIKYYDKKKAKHNLYTING